MVDYVAVTWGADVGPNSSDWDTEVSIAYQTPVETGIDCDSKLIHALTSLRQLNTSFDTNLTPNIVGRASGNNVQFNSSENPSLPTYSEYKMRRKANVLQYKNATTSGLTKKQYFSKLVRGQINPRKSNQAVQNETYTDPNPNNFTLVNNTLVVSSSTDDNSNCLNTSIDYTPTSNSDVPSSYGEFLYLDPSIQFYTQL